jgi:hypothetical protein
VRELREPPAQVFGRPEAEDFEEDLRARRVAQDEVRDEGALAEVYDFAARPERPDAPGAFPRGGEFFYRRVLVADD